jgi:hypothetical protein
MKIAALALLAFGCAATATAEPAPKPAPAPAPAPRHPPPKGCVAKGTPVLQIDHKAEPGAKLATSAFRLYESGAWTYEPKDAEGKPEPAKRGCLSADEKTAVKADLDAPWKVTTAQFHCMAYSSAFTEYTVNGKLVYTAKLCSGKTLDEASQKALTDLEGRLTKAINAAS